MADASKSYIRTLQRIGRGLRTQEGKEILYVHDFIDDGNKYLIEHSNARYDIYKNEGFECELVKDVVNDKDNGCA
jgi:superfamily II DNA or RNA helicase